GAYVDAGGDGYAHVVASRDYHIDPGDHFSDHPDFVGTWPPHCVAGTPGAEFHPDLDTSRLEAVFSKGAYAAAYSAFEGADEAGTPLAARPRERGGDALGGSGPATHACGPAPALDAAREGFDTRVLLRLTAGVDPVTTGKAVAALRDAGVELGGAAES